MPKDIECTHQENTLVRDLVIVVLVFIAFLVLREGLAWVLKTNQTEARLQDIHELLTRNGFR